jgi:hypothetical protein
MRTLKYVMALSLLLMFAPALWWRGGWTFLPLLYAFGFIPGLELWLRWRLESR